MHRQIPPNKLTKNIPSTKDTTLIILIYVFQSQILTPHLSLILTEAQTCMLQLNISHLSNSSHLDANALSPAKLAQPTELAGLRISEFQNFSKWEKEQMCFRPLFRLFTTFECRKNISLSRPFVCTLEHVLRGNKC